MEDYRIDPTIAYDVVELPSRGIYYANKKKSLRVAYLTAPDENILAAQNLLKNNGTIDEILKRTILDRDFNIEELVEEDRQAVLIFLRSTAWGSEYKFYLTDPKTGSGFTTSVDLSEVSFKDFKLVPDSNDEYKYFLPVSKVEITFKFLTRLQEKDIDMIEKNWNGIGAPPIITKRYEFMIKSVGGDRDMMNIGHFINKMPIKDSQEFRKFVNENKPSLELKREIKAPSGEIVHAEIGFGVEFFRPFYGL